MIAYRTARESSRPCNAQGCTATHYDHGVTGEIVPRRAPSPRKAGKQNKTFVIGPSERAEPRAFFVEKRR